MSYRVRLAHLIGDKPLPYELPCTDPVKLPDGRVCVFIINPSGKGKPRLVNPDRVYKPTLESA